MDPLTLAAIYGGTKLLGAGADYFGGKKAIRDQQRAVAQMLAAQEAGFQDVQSMYQPYTEAGQYGLDELVSGEQAGAFDFQMPDFQFQGTVEDYLSPAMDFERKQLEHSLAARRATTGGLNSGAAEKELAEYMANLGRQGYGEAYGRMTGDRAQSYQEFMNQQNAIRQNIADKYNRFQNLSGMGERATGTMANARMGLAGARGDAAMSRGQLGAQRSALPFQMASGLAGAAGDAAALYGGLSSTSPVAPQGVAQAQGMMTQGAPLSMEEKAKLTMQGMNPGLMSGGSLSGLYSGGR